MRPRTVRLTRAEIAALLHAVGNTTIDPEAERSIMGDGRAIAALWRAIEKLRAADAPREATTWRRSDAG